MSVDLVREAFEARGIQVQFDVMPYARCMALTKAGGLLACFNTIRNPALEPHYRWHRPAMFRMHYEIYAVAGSGATDLTLKDLEGRRVAVTNAYEYGPEFDRNPLIQKVVTLRDESNFRMLLKGRVDYTLAPPLNTAALMARQPDLRGRFKVVGTLGENEVYLAFSRRHPEAERLMNQFEAGLRTLHANGRVREIETRWLQQVSDAR